MAAPSEWFCALLDTAPDVYFRYALEPGRRVSYVSPSIEALTGHTPAEFYADPGLCPGVVASADRRLLRRILRARRGLVLTLHIVRDGVRLPVEVRTVTVIRCRRLVAIEGVARLLVGGRAARAPRAGHGLDEAETHPQPVQRRLAALMAEVHDLLHVISQGPPALRAVGTDTRAAQAPRVIECGALTFDPDRLVVTESGQPVALTSREVLVLRYFLERPGRVVTRRQLLTDVWNYSYTGDDRTIDVHLSRLRRKLPSLRGRLTALRQIGYRFDLDDDAARVSVS